MEVSYRILVTGSRDWEDLGLVYETLRNAWHWVQGPVIVIHGGCPTGADDMAHCWARPLRGVNVTEEIHRADWAKHGKAAGPIRNRQMVDAGADVCYAFIKNRSRGATGCADMAERAGIETIRFRA